MKTVKKLSANSIFLLSGKSVAKNAFFEDMYDVALAHRFIHKYLSGMINIKDYLFTPHGWTLIIQTKSNQEIQKAYRLFRARSVKAKEACIKTASCDMLSEHIRYCLSSLIKAMNKRHMRTGSKVHSVFERYIFESLEELEQYSQRMKAEAIELCNQIPKYKAQEGDFQNLQMFRGRGTVILCSKNRETGLQKDSKTLKNNYQIVDIKRFTQDVLGKLVLSTLSTYKTQRHSSNYHNSR